MSDHDLFLQTVEATYASGVDINQLPAALELTGRLFGAAGASFEVVDLTTMHHNEFRAVGPPAHLHDGYVGEFAALNTIPFAVNKSKGQVMWTYQQYNEEQIACNPFYDYMATVDLCYWMGAIVERTPEKLVILYSQRTRKQGHVDKHEVELMQQICPHFQRAYDLLSRLNFVDGRQTAIRNTLDWLSDGVALLRANGEVIYVNEALCALARHCDGLQIVEGRIEFNAPEANDRFNIAMRNIGRLNHDLSLNMTDFPIPRSNGMPAYAVALRPLMRGQVDYPDAAVMLLIHDPLARNIAAKQMLAELFNLTGAEANLAQALCAGMTTGAYASTRRISLNTVYTHLRRLREKTQCNSVAELVRRFSEMKVPLRLS